MIDHYHAWRRANEDAAAADTMRADPEMREFADEEGAAAAARAEQEREVLERLLLPRDPDDHRDVILEIMQLNGLRDPVVQPGQRLALPVVE